MGHGDDDGAAAGAEDAFELGEDGWKVVFREQVEHEGVEENVELVVGVVEVVRVTDLEDVVRGTRLRRAAPRLTQHPFGQVDALVAAVWVAAQDLCEERSGAHGDFEDRLSVLDLGDLETSLSGFALGQRAPGVVDPRQELVGAPDLVFVESSFHRCAPFRAA